MGTCEVTSSGDFSCRAAIFIMPLPSRRALLTSAGPIVTGAEHDEWGKPENWHGGWLGIYYAPRDPRVWVAKRIPAMGWTLNFAHRRAWFWLIGMVGIPILGVFWLAARSM